MINKKILFCTYDGLLDPLGQSQILPYVRIFKTFLSYVHILSFEKKKKYRSQNHKLSDDLNKININWSKLYFTRNLFLFGKIFDLLKMFVTINFLILFKGINVVHCRGYQPLIAIIILKKLVNFKIIFDMRGFWFDEKKDCNALNINLFHHRFIYNFLKKIEPYLLYNSDQIIVLTKKAKLELINKFDIKEKKITIIPCCADYNIFKPLNSEEKKISKMKLGLKDKDKVIAYLGSLGTWYLFEEMLILFKHLNKANQDFNFLFITNDLETKYLNLINNKYSDLKNKIIFKSSDRNEIRYLLGCADVTVSFIRPTYSKIASSPTKFAEALAMGLPVISNKGIGDIEDITNLLKAGVTIELNDELGDLDFNNISLNINEIIKLGGEELRKNSEKILSIDLAYNRYKSVYNKLNF